jgi:acyl-CoA thioesterase-1
MKLTVMGKILRSLLVVVPLAGACSRSQADTPRPLAAAEPAAVQPAADVTATAARPRIVFLGDSLTAGLGLPREQSVPSLIQARLDVEGYPYEVVNAGVSGDTSAGGLRRLDWALGGDVEILVVELGANDGLRGLPVAQMKNNLTEIVTRARERGIRVVLTGMEAPPNYGPLYTAEFRRAFRDLAAEHDVVFVPFFLEGVAGVPTLNNSDGIHPNAAGTKVIEGTIWRALEPLLRPRGTASRRSGSQGTETR